jgi:hypothetical protein
MQLTGTNGQRFELELAGYQFPELATAEYDSNWLIVRVDVDHPRGRWSASNACLLTYEVAELASWLESVARGRPTHDEVSFLEPNLLLRLVETGLGTVLRIYFELELRPPWAASELAGEEDLYVEFSLAPHDLLEAAADLRAQLVRYPQRTER